MKHLYHLLACCTLFISGSVFAQQDSGYIDLGRTKIRKDFAQTVTIKGRDLERMPFASIADALAPYFHGVRTNKANTVFVVDGNYVNDVNAYSIYDIEEITLVQNALGAVNGAVDADAIVLVTTKRKQDAAKGLTIAGGSSLVTAPEYEMKSRTNVYHQYHIGAWKNWGSIRAGASANFLRDVMPLEKSDARDVRKPTQLNRFRLNGWLEIDLARGHTLTARMNYVPQHTDQDNTLRIADHDYRSDYKAKQTLLNPSLRLTNNLGNGLFHELDVSYLNSSTPMDALFVHTMPSNPSTSVVTNIVKDKSKSQNFLLRDRISFSRSFGDWQFEPAVNFTYRKMKLRDEFNSVSYVDGQLNSIVAGFNKFENESYVLTPTVNFSYRNVFNIGGGLSYKLKNDIMPDSSRLFPFVHTMVDVLRLGKHDNPYSLKIFGSFAVAGSFADGAFSQADVMNEVSPNSMIPVYGGGPVLAFPYPQDRTSSNLQLGAVFSVPGNKVQVSYNFDNRQYVGMVWSPINIGGGYNYMLQYPDVTYLAHRVSILAKVLDKDGLQWSTGINATAFKHKIDNEAQFPGWLSMTERNDNKFAMTGGWTNRFQYKNFSVGLDMLYAINEYRLVSTPAVGQHEKYNSLRINHVYLGYGTKALNKPLEIYLTSRCALPSNYHLFPDRRQYFGAGFKLQF